MNRLEFLEKTNQYVRYKFYPEGDMNDYGIVQVDIHNYERSLIKAAKVKYDMYTCQAWKKVEQFVKKGEYPKIAISAWY